MIVTQLTVNGIIAGSIYALVAIGFALVYSTNKFMHLAHGSVIAVAAYIFYSFFSLIHTPLLITIVLTIIGAALFGLGMYRLIYVPLQKRKASNAILLMASLALLILFQNIGQLIFGASVKTIKYTHNLTGFTLLGAYVTTLQLFIVIIALLLFFGVYVLMKHTRLGKDMRAVADHRELAHIIGINHQRVADYSFLLGSALAGIAGILLALEQGVYPSIGLGFIIKGFTGAVIGGLSSVPASILGSYLIGFAENYGTWFVPSGFKDAISFVLLFIFLLFKPEGLFTSKEKKA